MQDGRVQGPPLALTMGEPAGIGGEIAAKAWWAVRAAGPAFFLIGDPGLVKDAPVALIEVPEQAAAAFPQALPVLPLPLAAPVLPGVLNPANAPAVIASIEQAVGFALAGRAGGVVTNPIQKSVLTAAGFPHPGHTEFLGELAGDGVPPVMMLACPGLRVVPVTVHLSLRAALATLTSFARNLLDDAILHSGTPVMAGSHSACRSACSACWNCSGVYTCGKNTLR